MITRPVVRQWKCCVVSTFAEVSCLYHHQMKLLETFELPTKPKLFVTMDGGVFGGIFGNTGPSLEIIPFRYTSQETTH